MITYVFIVRFLVWLLLGQSQVGKSRDLAALRHSWAALGCSWASFVQNILEFLHKVANTDIYVREIRSFLMFTWNVLINKSLMTFPAVMVADPCAPVIALRGFGAVAWTICPVAFSAIFFFSPARRVWFPSVSFHLRDVYKLLCICLCALGLFQLLCLF